MQAITVEPRQPETARPGYDVLLFRAYGRTRVYHAYFPT